MKIIIEYNKINYSLEVSDDTKRGDAEVLFKRLMLGVGYVYNDEEARDIIMRSNDILNGEV